jgi:hypothetical protein
MSLLRAGMALFTANFWKTFGADFGIAQANLFLRIANLCHQSLVEDAKPNQDRPRLR